MGWPSLAIDHGGVPNRVLEWAAFIEDIDAELYWDTIFAYPGNPSHSFPSEWGGTVQPDPWTMQTPTGQASAGGSGDGNLFAYGLPDLIGGTSAIPVESVRLKSVRDGVEDFEVLRQAEQKIGKATVLEMISPFIRSAWDFERSAAALQKARQSIGRILSER